MDEQITSYVLCHCNLRGSVFFTSSLSYWIKHPLPPRIADHWNRILEKLKISRKPVTKKHLGQYGPFIASNIKSNVKSISKQNQTPVRPLIWFSLVKGNKTMGFWCVMYPLSCAAPSWLRRFSTKRDYWRANKLQRWNSSFNRFFIIGRSRRT